jgi:hypothetical protein
MKLLQIFQEQDGLYSGRRVAAFIFIFLFAALSGYSIYKEGAAQWQIFIPAGLCVFACLLLFLFTTWADIKDVISAARLK